MTQSKFILTGEWNLEQIKDSAKVVNRLVYGFNTCWWKVGDPPYMKDGLPCGPRGEMLLETDKPLEFIEAAEKKPEHYGEFGLATFVAAYHGNVITKDKQRPTSFEAWAEYNALLQERRPVRFA